jgi:hypothetical protein
MTFNHQYVNVFNMRLRVTSSKTQRKFNEDVPVM